MTDDFTRAVEGLTRTVDKLRDELVRKDNYDRDRLLDQHRVQEVADDVAEIRADRKWILRMFIGGMVVPLINSLVLLWIAQQVVR